MDAANRTEHRERLIGALTAADEAGGDPDEFLRLFETVNPPVMTFDSIGGETLEEVLGSVRQAFVDALQAGFEAAVDVALWLLVWAAEETGRQRSDIIREMALQLAQDEQND